MKKNTILYRRRRQQNEPDTREQQTDTGRTRRRRRRARLSVDRGDGGRSVSCYIVGGTRDHVLYFCFVRRYKRILQMRHNI